MLDLQQTVANLVLDHSECVEVFQKHRIDFCCRGDMSIEAAAKEKGLAVEALLSELSQAMAARRGDRSADPREFSTPRLISHLISKHHEYLRGALPVVRALAAKVSSVHGDHNPKLRALDTAVRELADALIPHLDEEEQVLFPALMAKNPDRAAVTKLLDAMLDEHLSVASLLERIHAASDAFTVPEWGCNSYRTLFSELRNLETDVFAHVHLENHVLKPRFAA
ncbi:MAG: iron-sulfur cluster repair di-iron protein [Vicinamibacteria bacterium]